MRLVAPFGFYGWGNIGDESTLQGFGRLVRGHRGTKAWVCSRDPRHTRRVEPSFGYFDAGRRDVRRRWAWVTADAVVVPGGTPIMDVLGEWPLSELTPFIARAAREGLPVAFIGTGTEHLLREESRRIIAEQIAPHVLAWTVRSPQDKARLIEYGVAEHAVTPAADLAWLLDSAPLEPGREYLSKLGVPTDALLVGVNVNIEQFVRAQQPRLLETLARALDGLVDEHGAHILFLCNEVRDGATFDAAASREIIGSMTRGSHTTLVPNVYWPPQMMMSMIGCCRFTISTRYHFCLFSALQDVPFLAVKRSDKVADLCTDVGWTHALALSEMDPDRLRAMLGSLHAAHTDLGQHLNGARAVLRERSRGNATALERLAVALRT